MIEKLTVLARNSVPSCRILFSLGGGDFWREVHPHFGKVTLRTCAERSMPKKVCAPCKEIHLAVRNHQRRCLPMDTKTLGKIQDNSIV